MKRAVFCCLLLLFAACSRPRVIPDDTLAMIFRDAFLTNAYIGRVRVNVDSMKIYEPIFEQYGYSQEDVQYTIASFSKRKSARLGDVVEVAIKMLDEEGGYYDKEVAVLDTINNASRRAMAREVYADTLIRVQRLRDTSRLRIVVPDIRPGEYVVSMQYEVDSLDKNQVLRGGAWFDKPGRKTRDFRTFVLRRGAQERFLRTLQADTSDHHLIFDFAGLPDRPKRPSITIRDLKITYTPPVIVAVDSFYHRELEIRIFADEFLRHVMQKDSL